MNVVCEHDFYFVQKRDAIGLLGLSPYHKCTSTLRMLAYGVAADATDKYCQMGESIAMHCMKRFCKAIRTVFEPTYLRQPTREDIEKQMAINSARGFPDMFGSILYALCVEELPYGLARRFSRQG